MHSYDVALRITGKSLDPTETTAKLRLRPTQVRIAGHLRPGGKSFWPESMWEYRVSPKTSDEWPSLEMGLTRILKKLHERKRILQNFQRSFHVSLFCGHYSSSFNGGPTLSPPLLKNLSDLGIELFLDTYFSREELSEL